MYSLYECGVAVFILHRIVSEELEIWVYKELLRDF